MRGGLTWEVPAYAPAVAAAAVACVAFVVVIYRPQVRNGRWFWRWTVPGFRATAVVALLASMLKPSILRPAAPDNLGAVLVVLDDSPTMSVADASWTPAELVALADECHELPAAARRWRGSELADQVIRVRPLIDEAARAANELEYARVAGRSVEAAGARASRTRAALVNACNAAAARAASLPEKLRATLLWSDVATVLDSKGRGAWAELRGRVDAAAAAIKAYQAESDAKLYADDATVHATCEALAAKSRIELARQVVDTVLVPTLPPGVPVRIVRASDPTKDVVRTDAATRPVEGISARSDVAAAVRLLSQQPSRERRVRAIVVFSDGRLGGAVAPPQVGSPPVLACRPTPAAVRDVAIRHVTAPAITYVGDQASVRADVRGIGYAGSPVTVKVEHDDAVTGSTAILTADEASVSVPVRFDRAGVVRITTGVAPLAGEATVANNVVERYVRVSGDRASVIAFVPQEGRGAKAVRETLAHIPGVVAKVVTVAGSTAPKVEAADVTQRRVIVLDDVSVVSLSAEQLDAIREAVADRGGTLVMVAGRSHWPLDAESEALLDEYLPYRLTGGPSWRVAGGRPADDIAGADGAGLAAALAGVGRYLQLGDLRDGVRALVAERESGAPLVVESELGKGKVLTVAVDDRIGRGAEPDAERFWAELIRYAAGAPYAAEADGYALDVDRVDVESGGAVGVRAKVPLAKTGVEGHGPAVLLLTSDRVVRSEPLVAAGSGADGRFSAAIGNLSPGRYVLRLDAGPDNEFAPALEVPLHVRSPSEEELADVSPDLAFLAKLAEPSGGQVIPLTDAGRIAADVSRGDRAKVVEYALWDSPQLFLFVTACLATEWALRKRLGLA